MSSARLLLKRLATSLAGHFARPPLVRRDFVPIFMLHRFGRGPGRGPGHDPVLVRAALRYLRQQSYTVMDLDELVQELQSRELPERAVAFTIDDGYADQAEIGAELFLEFDCPATIFLVTGFVDGAMWPADAQVGWLLEQASHTVEIPTACGKRVLNPGDDQSRHRLRRQLIRELKTMPIAAALSRITELAAVLGTPLPESAPLEHSPITWADARRLEGSGIRFGAHSVNHALLAREDDESASDEIAGSLKRIRAELKRPSEVFCYPNGLTADYGSRERKLLAAQGCLAAVNSEPDYLQPASARAHPYDLPRFSFPDNMADFCDIVLQLQRLREQLRDSLPGARHSARKEAST